MTRVLFLVPAVVLLLGAGEPTTDLDQFQGNWRFLEYHSDRVEVTKERLKAMKVNFSSLVPSLTTKVLPLMWTFIALSRSFVTSTRSLWYSRNRQFPWNWSRSVVGSPAPRSRTTAGTRKRTRVIRIPFLFGVPDGH